MKRLKIAYISRNDPRNIRSWSGTPSFIFRSLEKHCGEVIYLGELSTPLHFLGKFINALLFPFNKRYNYGHSVVLSKTYAKQIEDELNKNKFDIIFSHGVSEIAFLKTDIPIFFTTDGTIPALSDYYSYFSNMLKFSYNESIYIEKRALENSALICYPSDWASHSAQTVYGIKQDKIRVIHYGANLETIPNRTKVLQRKLHPPKCRLLFVGVEWGRKGGEIAFGTMLELKRMGIDAKLSVCGVAPPKQFKHNDQTIIPFLNKNIEEDRLTLENLYYDSDFFILPTRAECAGIVFCEASAFGLPIITTNTGGVRSYVQDGVNGYCLPINAEPKDYAELIAQFYKQESLYIDIVKSSRDLFENKLNWDVWGQTVKENINRIIEI